MYGDFFILLFVLAKFGLFTSVVSASKQITLGVAIPWSGSSWDAGRRFASGILIAIDKINRDPNLLPHYNVTFKWGDSKCEQSDALQVVVDMYTKTKPPVDVIIGPACTDGCVSTAYLADHWNIPIISYGCGGASLSNKATFPTFARTVGVYSQSGMIFILLMDLYKWDRVAILTPTAGIWSSIMNDVRTDIENNKKKVSYFQNFNADTVTNKFLVDSLTTAKTKAHSKYSIHIKILLVSRDRKSNI